jgi:glycosyltransferase involved in cell wall biosynthesis
MAFYYVPAPAKRSAIIRDWVVMAFCRPLFPELILHWHAYGLGEWVAAQNDWQRKLTRVALGKADLSIVLNNYNKRDAEVFTPNRIEVVPNGIADQFPDYQTALAPKRKDRAAALKALQTVAGNEPRVAGEGIANPETVRFLFLGHLIETKGVFVAIEATWLANEELAKRNAPWRAHLTLAGSFASEEEKGRVLAAADAANKSGHGLKRIEEDRSARLADARTGGDALSRETPAQGGFVQEELRADEGDSHGGKEARRFSGEGAMIELVGFLDSEQKKSALEEADCLVFPTFYEGETQGLVLLEAMSSGLPVITTSWRGVPEVLPVGGLHACAIRNPEEVSRLMFKVVDFAEFAVYREAFLARFEASRFITSMAQAFSAANRKSAWIMSLI